MQRITASFSNTQIQTLEKEAAAEGVTPQEVLRHLVDELTFRRHPARKMDVAMVEELEAALARVR